MKTSKCYKSKLPPTTLGEPVVKHLSEHHWLKNRRGPQGTRTLEAIGAYTTFASWGLFVTEKQEEPGGSTSRSCKGHSLMVPRVFRLIFKPKE